jgi:hypothetical protein
MRSSAVFTKAGLWWGESSNASAEQASCSARRASSTRRKIPLAVRIADGLRYRRVYLHILWSEICNLPRRMAILRGKGLVRRGYPLQFSQDGHAHKPECPLRDMWLFVRTKNIRALRSIHPTATPIDFYFLASVIGPQTFSPLLEGDLDREAALIWTCNCRQSTQLSEPRK